jgi:hypothetical protein
MTILNAALEFLLEKVEFMCFMKSRLEEDVTPRYWGTVFYLLLVERVSKTLIRVVPRITPSSLIRIEEFSVFLKVSGISKLIFFEQI